MRNDKCRVTIIDRAGRAMARGVVADRDHVLTCRHNVEMVTGQTASIGNLIDVMPNNGTPDGRPLRMRVVKIGEGDVDVCALARTDSGRFSPIECALWQQGYVGDRFYGLGLTRAYADVALAGELKATKPGGKLRIVRGEGIDSRIEEGCSGAALFLVPDGPLVGMVTQYQQDESGVILDAPALAEFWPGLAAFNARPDDAFPQLVPSPVRTLPVSRMIRQIDRMPQKMELNDAIETRQLLTEHGFFLAAFAAVEADLPRESAQGLFDWNIAPIMRRLAPSADKSLAALYGSVRNVAGDAVEAGRMLRGILWRHLDAPSTQIEDLRAALRNTQRPLLLVLSAMGAELDLITEEMIRGMGEVMRAIAMPDEGMPVLLLIYVLADNEAALPDISSRLADNHIWCVPLDPLEEIWRGDVIDWADNTFPDQDVRDVAVGTVTKVLDRFAGGRNRFRLKELKDWLNSEESHARTL